jgi:hypothetical protein
LNADTSSGEGVGSNHNKATRRSGKVTDRPMTADSTSTDLEAAQDAEKHKDTTHEIRDFSVQMDILEDAFKNRFA